MFPERASPHGFDGCGPHSAGRPFQPPPVPIRRGLFTAFPSELSILHNRILGSLLLLGIAYSAPWPRHPAFGGYIADETRRKKTVPAAAAAAVCVAPEATLHSRLAPGIGGFGTVILYTQPVVLLLVI
ncbi:hypothetical protein CORC01_12055 [Colletotrichum orchidophilum]|uniref:Uncharacterized protein n=1 Tax=Colletotrichum orchidophilum TaxID=1209926 RepID=A0A1G4AU86_9PEZI|nr:uncharacterized protein CORC01_12055 [Colletotrichum orchidophilum]OHE92671.1 hypothetical protein CORC01_12055 [Colletotrichum orchidophilum]